MNRISPRRWSLLLVSLLTLGTLFVMLLPITVGAQGETPAATVEPATPDLEPAPDGPVSIQGAQGQVAPTATPAPIDMTVVTVNEGPPTVLGLQEYIWRLLLPLVFGLVALGGLIYYYDRAQNRYYEKAGSLGMAGRKVSTLPVRSISSEAILESLGVDGEHLPPTEVVGPDAVPRGKPSQRFTAKVSDEPVASVWSVIPERAATLSQHEGDSTTVTAHGGTSFILAAAPKDNQGRPVETEVPVIDEPAGEGDVQLAFVGRGAGSVLLAVLLLSVVLALGSINVISGEATATILGALAGYIFGIGRAKAEE